MSRYRCICGEEAPRFRGDSPGRTCEYCMLGEEEPEPEHIRKWRENAERWEYDPKEEENGIPL